MPMSALIRPGFPIIIAVLAALFTLLPLPASAGLANHCLTAPVRLATTQHESGVRLALADLARDLKKVLGGEAAIADGAQGDIVVSIDPALKTPESWTIEITDKNVHISGADELGAIYGIYQFSQRFLGVEPLWFWKDLEPAKKAVLELKPQVLQSTPPTFHWRGWFVNDEDLLTEWKNGGGARHIDYPFYFQVMHPDVADAVFEALLRSGGNLVIPSSFVDVMNEPEAALVKHAVARGLYVTQHHIEPLGLSHFSFENYWKARGEKASLAYSTDPEKVRQTWRAYAAKWHELAGDHVIWQLGLRGRGDRPVWNNDKGVKKEEAGALISGAIADEWQIVREVDKRPHPPATTTLWMEGSQLMRQGSLTFPEGITIVFADEGKSQTMQEDFYKTERTPRYRYGVYYHIGFWSTGPHLVQGTRPEKVKHYFDEVAAKDDTQYAIINVTNIREHVMGVQAASEMMSDLKGWNWQGFLDRFAPPLLHASYRELLASFVDLDPKTQLQDGHVKVLQAALFKVIAQGGWYSPEAPMYTILGRTPEEFARRLKASNTRLDKLIAQYPADQLTAAQRKFYDVNLLTQARMLRGLQQYLVDLIAVTKDPSRVANAETAMAGVIEARQAAAQGKWENWYRGDKKMNLPQMLENTRKLKAEKLGEKKK